MQQVYNLFDVAVSTDGILDKGVLNASSPDQLDWAEDPHGHILMGSPNSCRIQGRIHKTWRSRQGLLPHRRIRLVLLLP